MTVICWDGKKLAADKQMTSGNTLSTVTKIFRINGCLVGSAGPTVIGSEMIKWFREGEVASKFPKLANSLHGAMMIVVRPNHQVDWFTRSPVPSTWDLGSRVAIGSGDESAIVAMECGLDAEAAVIMVSKFNNGCGRGVDVLTFEEANDGA